MNQPNSMQERREDRDGYSDKRESSRNRSHHSESRHHSRRSRSRDGHRRNSRSRSRSDDRSSGRKSSRDHRSSSRRGYSKERKEDKVIDTQPDQPPEKEMKLLENEESLSRDVRTVFVSDLQVKVDEKWLRYYFEQAGVVKSIQLIRDRYSRKSKGMGYIEMGSLEDASKALMLNGQRMCTKHKACNCSGFPMKVKRSEAEKNWSAMKERPEPKVQPSTIYVTSLHRDLSRHDIAEFFETIGDIDKVDLELDEQGRSTGCARIKFRRPECASRAAIKTDGMEVLGQKIGVRLLQGHGSRSSLEDEEGRNVALDPAKRNMLMKRIAGSKQDEELDRMMNSVSNPGQAPTAMGADGKPIIQGNVSNCLVLKNMFTPAIETDPNWDVDIYEDVKNECQKYGNVLHCFVDKNSDGNVYLMFDDVNACRVAANEMNGRWFNRKQIYVMYIPTGEYINRFPDTRRLAAIAQNRMANSVYFCLLYCSPSYNYCTSLLVMATPSQQPRMIDLADYSVPQLENLYQTLMQQREQLVGMLNSMIETNEKAEKAIQALSGMKPSNIDNSILIPISTSILIPGKLENVDHVYISVGAGYVVEKTVDDATQFFSSQNSLFSTNIKSIRSQAMSIEDQLVPIKRIIDMKKAQLQQIQDNTKKE